MAPLRRPFATSEPEAARWPDHWYCPRQARWVRMRYRESRSSKPLSNKPLSSKPLSSKA
jgi:hypothetical protein